MSFWITEGNPYSTWDKLYLGGETWPGLCRIDATQSRAFEVVKQRTKEPKLRDNGYDPGKIKAEILVWEPDQWEELRRLIPKFSPRKNQTLTSPYQIYHPATDILGIDSVVIESVNIKTPTDKVLSASISMMQWFPERARGRRQIVGRGDGGDLEETDFDVPTPDPAGNL